MKLLELEFHRAGQWNALPAMRLGEGVTVVLGDNEAGKSTAMRAVEALLFGPSRELIAPLGSESLFHVSALARLGDGSELRFARHGRSFEPVLDRTPLAALLAPEHASRFRQLFRLSHSDVRAPPQFLTDVGALGRLLFAASSGANAATLSRLEERLEKRVKDAASGARDRDGLPKRIQTYNERRKAFEGGARFSSYDAELERRTALDARIARLQREIGAIDREVEELGALREGLARHRECEQRQRQLDAIAKAGPIPSGAWPERAASRLEKLEHAEEEFERARDAVARAATALGALPKVPAVAAFKAEIEALHAEVAGIEQQRQTLVKLKAKLLDERRELQGLLANLGSAEADGTLLGRAHALTAPAALRKTLDRLLKEGGEYETHVANRVVELRKATVRAAAAEQQVGGETRASTVGLELAKGIVAQLVEKTRGEAKRRGELADAHRQTRALASELGLADLDDAALVALPVADAATLQAASTALDAARNAVKVAAKARRELETALCLKHKEVAQLETALGAPPSEQDLAAARAARRETWESLKATWTPLLDAAAGARLPALGELFEQRVERADVVVDRRFADAERIGRWEATRKGERELLVELERAQSEERSVEGACADAERGWAQLWTFLRQPPADWKPWLAGLQRLRERLDVQAREHEEDAERAAAIAALRADLDALLAGEAPVLAALTVVETLRGELEKELQRRTTHNEHVGKLETKLEHEVAAVQREREAHEAAVSDLAAWQGRWELAVRDVPVGVGTDRGLVREWLDGQTSLAGHARSLQSAMDDEGSFEAAIAAFEQRACDVLQRVRAVDPELPITSSIGAVDAVRELLKLAKEAAEQAKKREERVKESARAETELKIRANAFDVAQRELRAHCAAGGLAEEAAPNEVREAMERAKKALGERHALTTAESLRDAKWPMGVEAALAAIAGRAEGELALAAEDCASKGVGLTNEHQVAIGDRQVAAVEIAKLERPASGDEEAQRLAVARTQVLERAEELLHLQVAQWLLGEARKRATEQARPLVDAASRSFAALTGGAYTALEIDRDARDPKLWAVPAQGRPKATSELSDGTLDQIWMALRLAVIQSAARETPFPLILDDVFVHFDDTRTTAALKLLGTIASDQQVIVFTHHDHVARLAQAALGDSMTLVVMARPELPEEPLAAPIERPAAPVGVLPEREPREPRDSRNSSGDVDVEQGCRLVMEALEATQTALNKGELIDAVRERNGVELEAAWPAVIAALKDEDRVQQTGEKRGARYSPRRG